MAKSTTPDLAAQLLAAPFGRDTPTVQAASDPLVDTPMQVTLEQIRPYQHNPRRSPNPQYDAIKASIRQRGLDQPPSITRRPGEEHFIIRNGGNTRLAILNELWQETGDERFHTLLCLFRPWTARGEILALTGHLAENELRGHLSYIERSQAVEQARQLYEQECGQPLNQTELAARLTADGYPVDQPSISRMGDTVAYLLPAIPDALHAGLGRPQVSKLLLLRKTARQTWKRHAPDSDAEFEPLFQHSLASCDGDLAQFSLDRVRDEVIGNLAQHLHRDYDELALDLGETELRRGLLSQLLEPEVPLPRPEPGKLPAAGSFSASTTQAAASDSEQLRKHIAELAQAISAACAPTIEVLAQNEGLGFACRCADAAALPAQGQALLGLWQALADPTATPVANLGALLCGTPAHTPWLDDETLARLFRLIKLARQLPHAGDR
ncbi:ParB N-terminal domain-containing protein [Pseudomonas carnis]|uniref:ParB family protein n=1 Tax=Pseudomonas TaxID=286 RepID=UPI000F57F83B|nr:MULTISPECIES: ParB family protein [Pseudomonas]AZC90166.1 ParB-like nuclease domain containing protein [Pseudomonas chlororaphis subsp. piscium]MBY8952569.1 ParB N-terminal domain-containing protein [Pseudomonas carnis]